MSTNITRIKQMIKDVNLSNKNNDKLEALKKYDDIKKYIELIYDPMIQFNLTSKTLKKNDLIDDEFNFKENDIFNILIDLNKKVFTGHKAIGVINKYINQFPDNKQLVYLMLDKNLKIRMSISLINKAFPNLIKEFKVKLANSYKDTMSLDFENADYFASRKLDGCLKYDTIVEIEGIGKKTIKEVVDEKIEGKIKCFNDRTQQIEYKKIINRMVNLDDINEKETKWFEIELENGGKITLTGNHRVWIPEIKAYRRVDELKGDEEFLKS